MKTTITTATTLGFLTFALHAATVAPTNGEDEQAQLAMQLNNPVAALISVPLQSNWDFGIGPSDAYKYTLKIQPVIPITLNSEWNLISRTILPVIDAESPAPGIDDAFGLGNTFTVVDGINNFYSKAAHRGNLDTAVAPMTKVYGFQPPLAEFVLSDPYRDMKRRVTGITYLGKGTVRESGGVVPCHRIGMHGTHADAELWLGVGDSLPRRLKATKTGSAGKEPLMDDDFLTWNMNPKVNASAFRHQPAAGATEIPMFHP